MIESPFDFTIKTKCVKTKKHNCKIISKMGKGAIEYFDDPEHKHVHRYIHMIPEANGIPKFKQEVTRDLKKISKPNIIYPIPGNLAVHIFHDPLDVRNYYIPIEPPLYQDMSKKLNEVELAFVSIMNDKRLDALNKDVQIKMLDEILDEICIVVDNPGDLETEEQKFDIKKVYNTFVASLKMYYNMFRHGIVEEEYEQVILNTDEFKAIKYIMLRDKIENGVLEPLLKDPWIEDISCSGLGHVFVEHKIFGGMKTMITFQENTELDTFVIKLSEKIGKPITYRDPIIDATLPDGSRINIVYGNDVSRRGSNFTIRKFAGIPLSILDLINFGSLNYQIAAYLWIMLENGMNAFVAGETASGKTTLLNALTTFFPADYKVVTIEDTPEIQVPLKNWTQEATRNSKEDSGSGVSMEELLRASLRQRPNEIMIGEIRGVEGNIAFQAMQTGHPVMSTFHAANVEKLIQRLTGFPINVPKTYIDNLHLVICQNAVSHPTKGMIRRATSINEIIGYDPQADAFSFIEVFKWDPVDDEFEFTGNLNSHLLENKIAPMLGMPESERRKIYDEVDKRALLLKKIHQRDQSLDFYTFFNMLVKIKEEGIV
jgi:flagellar protein FlaI